MGRAYSVRKASIEKTGAKKAKLYSNYSKEIYLASKSGTPDPEINQSLKRIIEKAKKDQVPSDIINRAIEKAKGLGTESYEEITYEGFGPGGSTLIINCLTDNVNRTVGFVRAAFNKIHKALGVTNSVSFNYDYLAVLTFASDKEEEIFEEILNNEIEIIDIENEDGEITIYSNPTDINKIKDVISTIIPDVAYIFEEVGMFAKEEVVLEDDELKDFERLHDLLDDIDDVVTIYHNVKQE